MILFGLVLVLSISAYAAKTPANEDFYLAAVVEYNPLTGNDTITLNAREYVDIIKSAAPKADIIVFPEVGIFLYDEYTTFITVPNPNEGIAPADDESCHPVLRMISSETRNQNVYVVINVHEEYSSNKETFHYNTNVIFNRTGHIIGRYRKFNLFAEPLNVTSTPELVFFDSDFGVRFGTFICFDILYEKPSLQLIKEHNVTDILYPTFWYSALPFFTAVQTQAGWAYANDVNLLASGGNRVGGGQTGSGIYAGKKGPVVYLQAQRDQTTILFSKVFKKGTIGTSQGETSQPRRSGPLSHLFLLEDPVIKKLGGSYLITPDVISPDGNNTLHLSNYTSIIKQFNSTVCHNKFCCSFNMTVTISFFSPESQAPPTSTFNPYLYRLAAFDGITKYNIYDAGVQFCAIVPCLNNSLESCGQPVDTSKRLIYDDAHYGNIYLFSTVFQNVKIETHDLADEAFVMPSLLELNPNPEVFGSLMNVSQFSFYTNGKNASLKLLYSKNPMTSGFYGRVFSRDNNNGSSAGMLNATLILIISLSLLCLKMRSSA